MAVRIAKDARQRSFFTICALVIVLHMSLIAWFTFQNETFKTVQFKQRLLVQTVALEKLTQTRTLPMEAEVHLLERAPPEQNKIENHPTIEEPKFVEMTKTSIIQKNEPTSSSNAEQKKTVAAAKLDVKKPAASSKLTKPLTAKPAAKPAAKAIPANASQKMTAAASKSKDFSFQELTTEAAARKKQLLIDAQNSLKKVGSPSHKVSDNKKIALAEPPKSLSVLQNATLEGGNISGNSPESHYGKELISTLKRLLKLPQYGEIEVQLTLMRSGKVAKLIVTKSQNAINKTHIENILPTLVFSTFGNSFAGEEQHTFKIRLSNELLK